MNGQTHGGKGSAQRPVDQAKFDTNWDAIFTRTSEKQEDQDFDKEMMETLFGEDDYIYVCNGCNQALTAHDMWSTETQEMYDIGDRQVWETLVEHHCEYCGSDNIEELL